VNCVWVFLILILSVIENVLNKSEQWLMFNVTYFGGLVAAYRTLQVSHQENNTHTQFRITSLHNSIKVFNFRFYLYFAFFQLN